MYILIIVCIFSGMSWDVAYWVFSSCLFSVRDQEKSIFYLLLKIFDIYPLDVKCEKKGFFSTGWYFLKVSDEVIQHSTEFQNASYVNVANMGIKHEAFSTRMGDHV